MGDRVYLCAHGFVVAINTRAFARRYAMLKEEPKLAQQYSLAHLTVLGCAPPEMTYIAARAGYDFVSIRSIYMGLPGEPNYALSQNPDMLRQTDVP